MSQKISFKVLGAFAVGLLVGAFSSSILSHEISHLLENSPFASNTTGSEEYHIHADFLIMIDETEIDLSPNNFMSVAERILHPHVHLHDNNGKVIHFHAPNITLKEFLSSLHIELTKDCLVIEEKSNCVSPEKRLSLYVNGEEKTSQIESYVPSDEDKILLFYGTPSTDQITADLNKITNDACFYSGTCLERGVAPSESCGLTCEL
jgi:hypothetical protein